MQFGLRWFATARVPTQKLRITSRAWSSIGFSRGNHHDLFVSRMDAVASQGVPTMLRKTRSVLAKAAALIAHRGHWAALGVAGAWEDSAAPDGRLKGEVVPQRDKIKRRVVSC
jgi:hypothetical protein